MTNLDLLVPCNCNKAWEMCWLLAAVLTLSLSKAGTMLAGRKKNCILESQSVQCFTSSRTVKLVQSLSEGKDNLDIVDAVV